MVKSLADFPCDFSNNTGPTMAPDSSLKFTDLADIPSIIKELDEAFRTGKTESVEWRKLQIRQLWKMMDEQEDVFSEALRLDCGKPKFEAQLFEMGLVKNDCLHALAHVDEWMQDETVDVPFPFNNFGPRMLHQPRGVGLIIGPWNFPVNLTMLPLLGAITAGCCAVVKPSEHVPRVSQRLAELLPKYLDPDCFRIVNGDYAVAEQLLKHRFDAILFTGSRQNGKSVMEAAAKNLTPVTLELGGKSPIIVSDKANLPIAAKRLVWARFWNEGQICMVPEYACVQESIHDEFVSLVKKVKPLQSIL